MNHVHHSFLSSPQKASGCVQHSHYRFGGYLSLDRLTRFLSVVTDSISLGLSPPSSGGQVYLKAK